MKMVTNNFYASPRDIDSVISVCLKIGQENLFFFYISALFNFNQNIVKCCLTLSWQRSLSYRSQIIDLQTKSVDWFLFDRDLRHERVIQYLT